MLITKDMGIMEIVQKYPATVEVLQRFGMGCIGCAAAHFENIEQGALAHGIDVPRLMEALMLNQGFYLSSETLLVKVWGSETVRRTVWPAA